MEEERERRLSATLHRYYVRPKEDASSAIVIMVITLFSVHGALLLYGLLTGSTSWSDYRDSHQFLVAVLLYIWLLGFHVISLTVHYRFEQHETASADDFYMLRKERLADRPLLVALPDTRIAIGMPEY